MDDAVKTLIAQSPGTAAVILVAWLFLKELRAQRGEYFNESQQRMSALKDITANHDEAHKSTGEKLSTSLDENTRVIARNSVALERCEEAHRERIEVKT